MAREMYEANKDFLIYQEEIATSPVYSGMPDLRYENGTIQWEAPSNRTGGQFRDSHIRRLQWWRDKAESIGISIRENQWISKSAKSIHPTKVRPCKKCGRVMDIRYCYFSSNIIARIKKLHYFRNDVEINDLTNIFDFVPQFIKLYGNNALRDLPRILSCKQFPVVPVLKSINEWQEWLLKEYITVEPSLLSPGAMSNAPDRLDGFHSFNRCCRSTADKGRTKQNLALYSTDRRAFEHWVDGNWVAANMLMGLINSNPHIKSEPCLKGKDHPLPCSADHIGPVSLGFAHRPEFQLLCKPCNSAKNNRMFFSDIISLRRAEINGEQINSWYSEELWKLINANVTDGETALRLCRIFRDNRHNAMMTLAEFLNAGHYLFLYTFLNLDYANYSYEIKGYNIKNHIVTATFDKTRSELKYVLERKARRVRVAFSALAEYSVKENRNGFRVILDENSKLLDKSIYYLHALNYEGTEYKKYNDTLFSLLNDSETSEEDLRKLLSKIPNFSNDKHIVASKNMLLQIMNNIAVHLFEKWDDLRYLRDINAEQPL